MSNSFDNIPPYVDQDQQPVTITVTRYQARLVLSALNREFVDYEQRGCAAPKEEVRKAYQSIDHQVYGVRLAREGRQEASL